MTTPAEPLACDRCHRRVQVKPVWWFGKPLGTTCAARYGLKPEKKPPRVKQPVRTDVEQPVLDGLEEEINESER